MKIYLYVFTYLGYMDDFSEFSSVINKFLFLEGRLGTRLNFKVFLKFSNFLKSSDNLCMQFLMPICKLQNSIKWSFFTFQTLPWFWSVISSFNQEELSRLLQFTTGCSQLPPEGFAGLNPKFKISRNWSIDVLPMASTWYI